MPLDLEMSSRQQERRQQEQRGKIMFRSLVILFAIIGLILQSLVAVQSTHPHYDDGIWFSPESFIFVSSHKNRIAKSNDDGSKFGFSLIWCTAELLTMRSNKRGIHPGALVGVDLILWMGFLCAGLFEILIGSWNEMSAAAGALGLTCRCVLE